jgi:two-component system catabolic regulation response regulator CreB
MNVHHFLLISPQDSLARVIMPYVVDGDRLSFAANPLAASALLRQESLDAVFVALEENDEEAAVFCRTIRHFSNAPIVMLVYNSAREQVTRGYRLGADAHINLPCDPRIFRARISAVLRRAQTAAATAPRAQPSE